MSHNNKNGLKQKEAKLLYFLPAIYRFLYILLGVKFQSDEKKLKNT